MADKRQVIYDIERCICHVPDACMDCSHYTGTIGFLGCMENLMSDALAMLKEQEPVAPERMTVLDFGSFETTVYLCGVCRMSIDCGDKFCKHCGRKVQW